MPVCAGDSFEIGISLLSLEGALDSKSISWLPIKSEPLPSSSEVRDYNRVAKLTQDRDMKQKYFADLRRVCEVEDTVVEWFDLS